MSGGTPRQVVEDVVYLGADFSPDGKELAVVRVADGRSRIEFPVGKTLVADKADAPRFSRDGRFVAFWETIDDVISAVSVIGRDGQGKKVLSKRWINVNGAPCWNLDDREIWFTANEHVGMSPALWAVDLSGKLRLVMRLPGPIEISDIAKDGRVLLQGATFAQSVHFASDSDPAGRELSWLDGSSVGDLSIDGKTVLLNEVGEGAGPWPVAYLRATDGSSAVRLGDAYAWSLAPDGKWVLAWIPPLGGKTAHLSLLPTGPGQPLDLEGGELNEFAWGSFLPDGKSIVFSAREKQGLMRLFVQTLPGGKPKAVGPERLMVADRTNSVSPDGRFVVAVRRGEIRIVPLDGSGPGRALPGLSTPEDRVQQWSSDSRHLYTYRRGERPQKVWLYDVATGERRLWKEFPYDNSIEGIRVRMTPGGDFWSVDGRRTLGQLYVVEGLR
jgi:Tol biopolymer transport system component